MAGTWLAARTEVAAASGDDDAPDRPATTPARLAGALVNAQERHVVAGAPLDVNIIAKTGALKLDGVLENFPHRLE